MSGRVTDASGDCGTIGGVTQPTDAPGKPASAPAGWLERLRLTALRVPGLGSALSAVNAGLGEILVVVLLLIAMPLVLMLIVGAFQFGGTVGGFLLLGAIVIAVAIWVVRRRTP